MAEGDTDTAGGARVLVAEDDAGLRELVTRHLARAGFRVRAAASGEEALAALAEEPVALLLLDYILGDMTGLAVLDALEARGAVPPFIVTTGQGSESLAVDIMKRGARDYLVKDATFLDRLVEHVRKTLHQIETEQRLAELERRVRRAEQLETLARVTGGIAHEFHNLLAVIKNAAWLLLEKRPGDETVGRYATEVDRHADRAAELTGRLLTFAEPASGEEHSLDAGALLHEVAEILGPMVGPAVRIAVSLPPGGLRIRGDLGRLRQMLLDLGRNASEAMPEGGEIGLVADTIDLSGAQEEAEPLAPGPYLRIAVRDTGTGMDAETRRRAFEPFFTTRAGGASVGGNVGLGLPSAHGCASAHGGSIRLESAPGRGTTVWILLPLSGEGAAGG